MGQMTLYYSVT